ncbi:3002_t:CDS:2, partial [Gigaspora rosea]
QRERELELSPESDQVEQPENAGFWRRLGQKLGLVKKPNPLSRMERPIIVSDKIYLSCD